MDQLALVQTVDGLGQGIVVAVTSTAHRRGLTSGLGPASGVANAAALGFTVAVVSQRTVPLGTATVQRLLQRIQHKVRTHGAAWPSADDAPGVDVHEKGNILPTLPCRDIFEIADPNGIRMLSSELPIKADQPALNLGIADRCSTRPAPHHSSQTEPAHQPCDGAARHRDGY